MERGPGVGADSAYTAAQGGSLKSGSTFGIEATESRDSRMATAAKETPDDGANVETGTNVKTTVQGAKRTAVDGHISRQSERRSHQTGDQSEIKLHLRSNNECNES